MALEYGEGRGWIEVMAFGSGAWESVAGQGNDGRMRCESGGLMMGGFATEFVHKRVGRCAAGPAWVRR